MARNTTSSPNSFPRVYAGPAALLALLVLLQLTTPTHAGTSPFQFAPTSPLGVSASCATALTASIPDCDETTLFYTATADASSRSATCTPACQAALTSYTSRVASSCASDVALSTTSLAPSSIASYVQRAYVTTCAANQCESTVAAAIGGVWSGSTSNAAAGLVALPAKVVCSDCAGVMMAAARKYPVPNGGAAAEGAYETKLNATCSGSLTGQSVQQTTTAGKNAAAHGAGGMGAAKVVAAVAGAGAAVVGWSV
ncbi:hypothetical protein AMAG_09608 [Allomyces macrogynus ATCC 38327]|uniref:Uncharacterized protein n=1 Tax=Allomyces macrogynus (strain ATCC 38327) TaxID=578462 RepID=A0A0L0SST5_ALLM3|nr:hypothetical protein AMAG_09608 [Allomyces macrogynus ATCC 38327]|eukprot:KNE65628.1 hypothetical protein AMAG_09608 [Allomyces macrogynus ATCC 38327]